jgi:hypothetical protein
MHGTGELSSKQAVLAALCWGFLCPGHHSRGSTPLSFSEPELIVFRFDSPATVLLLLLQGLRSRFTNAGEPKSMYLEDLVKRVE